MSTPTREIMWNVGSIGNVVAMYLIFAFSMLIAIVGIIRHSELVLSGKEDKNYKGISLSDRLHHLFFWAGLQKGVIKESVPGVAHTMIFLGFMALLFTTTMVFIDHDLGIKIYQGNFYLFVTILSDVLGLALIIGCGIMAHRRYLQKVSPDKNTVADALLLGSLALLCIQGFLLEGLRIHATNDPWALYSPVGLAVAKLFWFLSPEATSLFHYFVWWFHTLTVFGVLAIAPYTKFLHVLASTANLFFTPSKRAKGALKSPGDLEALIEAGEDFSIGTGTISDYSMKNLLDLEACTSCGRCQDVCPAYNSGKPLSPKWLILDTRNFALELNASNKLGQSILPKFFTAIDSFLTKNVYLKSLSLEEPETPRGLDTPIAKGVIDPETFWSCTTCMACVEACPVGINHVEQIVENRRHMVLMEGEVPSEAQGTLRALENRANPYGPQEERANWCEGLDVPILKPGDSVEYLYWVGCISAFDLRKQKIAKSLVKIFNAAGISYGILGKEECCTGDPARRIGEENLFQMLAKQNLATLQTVDFQKIVTNCPHCLQTLSKEYPEFGQLGNSYFTEVIHHSQLIQQLLESGEIEIDKESQDKITFHDPCYLGRYNDEYEAPRSTLKSVKGLKILEMEESGPKSMCCGAGGGHFWMDMKEGERINNIRIEQAAKTGANKVATACPFCMHMLEDSVKLTDREEELEIRDIAEVIADHLV